ncbi:immunity 53 family protein, partial [Falsiroseomonas sp. E2-1-a4]|uniref:immunity 53 family protein n=1 Tax=Falsiroseomonas sp. E2-1-a4 TaxID=3239299 RepID=UPI003F2B27D5
MTALNRLQEWFRSECDGDWEHQCGLRVETLDNPGWSLTLRLGGTKLEGLAVEPVARDGGAEDWLYRSEQDGELNITCGPGQLVEAVELFLDTVQQR